jgi:hypothetical protein
VENNRSGKNIFEKPDIFINLVRDHQHKMTAGDTTATYLPCGFIPNGGFQPSQDLLKENIKIVAFATVTFFLILVRDPLLINTQRANVFCKYISTAVSKPAVIFINRGSSCSYGSRARTAPWTRRVKTEAESDEVSGVEAHQTVKQNSWKLKSSDK